MLKFVRDFVMMNRPAVFVGCVGHWPALHKWTHRHLRSAVGDKAVHVALTPNGLADAVVEHAPTGERVFAKPYEALLPFTAFLDAVESPLYDASGTRRRLVHYVSHQNSSLTDEFRALWPDVDLSLPWADRAFGDSPAAANLWMGEDAARTTAHADLYENLYVVVRGTKRFTLLPPHDVHALGVASYRDATWQPRQPTAGPPHADTPLVLTLDHPPSSTPWIAGAAHLPERRQPLLLRRGRPADVSLCGAAALSRMCLRCACLQPTCRRATRCPMGRRHST
jgi:hypothetical protein